MNKYNIVATYLCVMAGFHLGGGGGGGGGGAQGKP